MHLSTKRTMDSTVLLATRILRRLNGKIFFIAEIGINHNGDMDIAKELIKRSKQTGFNAVKFQKELSKKFIQKKFWINQEKVLGQNTKRSKRRFGI